VGNNNCRQVVGIIKATTRKISTLVNDLLKTKHNIIKRVLIALEVRRAQTNPTLAKTKMHIPRIVELTMLSQTRPQAATQPRTEPTMGCAETTFAMYAGTT
jgi:hypothetical protein